MNAERMLKRNVKYRDEFRGCLIGGAAGDALGYPVEFLRSAHIFEQYGPDGICEYDLAPNGKARISDDTQMTLFTAMGMLYGTKRCRERGIGSELCDYVGRAYHMWYLMQTGSDPHTLSFHPDFWLYDIPEMGESRAPGNTCMAVIRSGHFGSVDHPVNSSKGCGGIMRVAPVGLCFNRPAPGQDLIQRVWEQGAAVAALTHGHELGWLPSAMLAHIVNRLTYTTYTVWKAVSEAVKYLKTNYADREHTRDLAALIDKAKELARNGETDLENIQSLGEGWVAEETLAIAVYCSLRYEDDFSKALCAAVNHNGDSDSTGAVTGNIMGALWGYERIPQQWKENLECADVILRAADELCCDADAPGGWY